MGRRTIGRVGLLALVWLFAGTLCTVVADNVQAASVPVADAGANQLVELVGGGATMAVTLDGSGSSDPDPADVLTYAWTWDGGAATGVSPVVALPVGTTVVTLVVSDGELESEPDTVDIIVAGHIIYVDDDAPGDTGPCDPAVSDPAEDGSAAHPFDTIQEAINEAASGDAIQVAAGTYRERLTWSGKALDIIGAGRDVTTIDAESLGRCLYMWDVPSGRLEGFTLTGGAASSGGAIMTYRTVMSVVDNTFKDNVATLYNGGGAYFYDNSSATLTGNVFTNNSSIQSAGALYINTSSAVVDNNVFTANSGGTGGAVRYYKGSGTLSDNTFQGNTSTGNGGAIEIYASTDTVTLTGNEVSGNTSIGTGGGIYAYKSDIDVADSIISDNTGGGSGGGGIFGSGITGTVAGNRFSGNSASGSGGGAIYFYLSGPPLDITGNIFTGNSATSSGGAIYVNNCTSTIDDNEFTGNVGKYGGAIRYYLGGGTLSNNIITDNGDSVSTEHGGGAYITTVTLAVTNNVIEGNSTRVQGGGIITTGTCTLDMSGNIVRDNTASDGAGMGLNGSTIAFNDNTVSGNNGGPGQGGGLWISACTVTGNGNTIDGNQGGWSGGGIRIHGGSTLTLTSGSISGNSCGVGGGIFAEDATLDLSGLTIATNTASQGAGVHIRGASAKVRLQRNAIHSNSTLGIDLYPAYGVNANDPGDGDTGPNDLQNYPVLAGAKAGATTRVLGSLDSTPGATFELDFYASAAADPSGYGEGERWLGATHVATDAFGLASFDLELTAPSAVGEAITATATNAGGSTSEFSGAMAAVSNFPPVINDDQAQVGEDGPAISIDLTANDTDLDGDDVEITSVDTAGTRGTVAINPDNDSVTYDPDGQWEWLGAGETAADTFTYTISDGHNAPFSPQMKVEVYTGVSGNLASGDAARAAGPPSATGTVTEADFWDTGGGGHFGVNNPVPGFSGGDNNNYAVFVTGTLYVNIAGTYTFGTYSDDNSRIRIDLNQNGDISDDGNVALQGGCCGDVFGSSVALAAGKYAFEAVYTEGGGGSYGEFFYAPGTRTAFDGDFRLIGDDSQGIAAGTVATATVTVTVAGVNDAPVAVDDSAWAYEDTVLVVEADPSGTTTQGTAGGPGLYLRFEERIGSTAANEGTLGAAADGTVVDATLGQPGMVRSAFEFDGTNDYITTATASTLGIQNSSFTAMAWVNPVAAGRDETIFGTDQSGTNVGLHLVLREGKVHFGFYANDTGGSATVPTNEWSHIAWRYDISTGEQAIFINGALDRASSGHAAFAGNGVVNVGRWLGTHYFDGRIDEAAIFGGVALSHADIAAIAAAGRQTGSLLDNDHDPDAGDTLSVVGFDAASALGATVAVAPDGSYTYDPTSSPALGALALGEIATDTFTYTIADSGGLTSTATVTISVARHALYVDDDGVNDPGPNDNTVSDPDEDGSPLHPFDRIQEAIDAAADGDTVFVLAGTYDESVTWDAKSLDVLGAGREVTIVDAGGAGRCLTITNVPAPARIEGLTFTGGSWGHGGGLCLSDSSLTLEKNTIAGNSVSGDGGGVWIGGNSSPTLTDNIIDANHAPGSDGEGGGLFIEGAGAPVLIRNVISGNTCFKWGGGVRLKSAASATLTDNTFTANRAEGGGALNSAWSTSNMDGNTFTGNRAVGNGGVTIWQSTTILTDNRFIGNIGETSGAPALVISDGSTATLTDNTFEANEAQGDSGALVVTSNSWASLLRDVFTANTATGSGGAIGIRTGALVTATEIVVQGNTAAESGGGIYVESAALNASHVIVTGNTAGLDGGGISVTGTATATLSDSTITANSADNNGGGLHIEEASASQILNSTFTANTCGEAGGAMWLTDTRCRVIGNSITGSSGLWGAGIRIDGGAPLLEENSLTLTEGVNGGALFLFETAATLRDNEVTDNYAVSCAAGAWIEASDALLEGNTISNNVADIHGGGLSILGGSPTLTDNIISNNSAEHLGGGVQIIDGSAATLTRNVISGNTCTRYTGGVYISGSSGTSLLQNDISGNTAGNYGGGVSLGGSDCVVTGNTVTGNTSGYAAGFRINGCSPTLTGNTITDNVSAGDGGGIHATGCAGTFDDNTITGNSADRDGGGLYIGSTSSPTLTDNAITANSAGGKGGGISIASNSSATIADCAIDDNDAVSKGGGIYLSSSAMTLETCSVARNTVADSGGGLHVEASSVVLTHNTISQNTASGPGGGLRFLSSVGTLTDNEIDGNHSSHAAGGDLADSPPGLTLTANRITNNVSTGGMGGLMIWNSSPVLLENIIEGNSAANVGGGLRIAGNSSPALTGNTIRANLAGSDGGGLFIQASSPTLTDNQILDNHAGGGGGGAYLSNSSASWNGNTVSGNTGYSGGGLHVEASSPILTDDTIRQNTASGTGGGIHVQSAILNASHVIVTGNTAGLDGGGVNVVDAAGVTLTDSTVAHNSAGGNGGGICLSDVASGLLTGSSVDNNSAGGNGGGMHLLNAAVEVRLNGFSGNTSTVTGYAAGGGALSMELSSPAVAGNTFTANHAAQGGGAIRLRNRSAPTITDNEIVGNSASGGGGGLYMYTSSPTMTGNRVAENSADAGGGMVMGRSAAHVEDNDFEDNTATGWGGGVWIELTPVPTLVGNRITRNKSLNGWGGGVSIRNVWDGPAAILNGNTINANETSGYAGGGVNCYDAQAALTGNFIFDNTASGPGGGVNVRYGAVSFQGDQIYGNRATHGGGVYALLSDSVEIVDCSLTGNTALTAGGGVNIEESTFTMSGNVLTDNTAPQGAGARVYRNSTGTVVSNAVEQNHGTGVLCLGASPTIQGNSLCENADRGLILAVRYDSGGNPALAAQDLLSEPVVLDNTIADNGAWGIEGQDTAAANAATLEADNTLGANGSGQVCQWWHGAVEVVNCDYSPAADATVTILNNDGDTVADYGPYVSAATGFAPDTANPADGRTWPAITEFVVGNDGMRQTMTPHTVQASLGTASKEATHGWDGRYQVAQIRLNTPPIANAGPDQTVEQTSAAGAQVTLDGSGSFDPDGPAVPLTYSWSEGGVEIATGVSPTVCLNLGTHTITLTVTDDFGYTGTNTVVITVQDTTPPTLTAPADVTVEQSAPLTPVVLGTPSVSDICDPSPTVTNDAPDPTAFSVGEHVVTWTATDFSGNSSTAEQLVTVLNLPPVVEAGASAALDEGDTFESAGSFSDSGQDPCTATVDYGDGSGEQPLALNADGTFTLSHTYADNLPDNAPYTVTVTVTDEYGASGSDTAAVAVSNVAPTVGAIDAPLDPVEVSCERVSASAVFADPGILDTHTAVWDWGDTTTTPGVVTAALGCGLVEGTHHYAVAGVYTVRLTLTDSDGASATSVFQYVVVYDAEGGFVTGGGWITSPLGAYLFAPTLTGKATFGFNSKYKKGANVPTGKTNFQFKAGDFHFHSSSYQWLVVAGAKAKFKGTGTINGTGDYGLLLTAVDGALPGGGGVDKFRIKIWDKDTDEVVYDNKRGESDDSSAATAIGGGSIVIHKK